MKRLLQIIGILLISTSVSAGYIISGTPDVDVGDLDTFIVEDALVGSPDSEALWVQTQLGDPTVEWTISQFSIPYIETTTMDIWAFAILDDPEYFIIKNSTRIALYANNIDYGYGVFDINDLSSALNIGSEPFTISHVTSLNGGGGGEDEGGIDRIPEPSLPALLGVGLIGMGFIRKHNKIEKDHK